MRIRKSQEGMDDSEILLVAKVSDALSHPARIQIYQFIMRCNKDMQMVCNGDVVAAFDYSQATISQHLRKLVQAELIQEKSKDRRTYYFANIGMLMKYLDATRKFSTFKAT